MSRQDFPRGYVCVAACIPGDLPVLTEHDLRLRPDLNDLNAQTLGDRWIEANETAVLKVSSAVVPREHIYLLNPSHQDFGRIAVDPPALFHFDPRLFDPSTD